MNYPDEVEITTISIDATYKNETEGTPFSSDAYIEEESQIRYGGDGMPLDPITIMFLPPTIANKAVKEGDYIAITKLHGETPNSQEAMRKRIKKIAPVGGHRVHHMELVT